MTKFSLCFVVLVAMAVVVFGATPVATISSGGSFELRGTAVNTQGVPSWPVLAGDEIATSGSAAVVRFADGTRVTLGAKSRAKVEKTDDGLVFRLVSGAMNFTLAQAAGVSFFDNAKAVPAAAGVPTSVTSTPGRNFTPLKVMAPPPPGSLSAR